MLHLQPLAVKVSFAFTTGLLQVYKYLDVDQVFVLAVYHSMLKLKSINEPELKLQAFTFYLKVLTKTELHRNDNH